MENKKIKIHLLRVKNSLVIVNTIHRITNMFRKFGFDPVIDVDKLGFDKEPLIVVDYNDLDKESLDKCIDVELYLYKIYGIVTVNSVYITYMKDGIEGLKNGYRHRLSSTDVHIIHAKCMNFENYDTTMERLIDKIDEDPTYMTDKELGRLMYTNFGKEFKIKDGELFKFNIQDWEGFLNLIQITPTAELDIDNYLKKFKEEAGIMLIGFDSSDIDQKLIDIVGYYPIRHTKIRSIRKVKDYYGACIDGY